MKRRSMAAGGLVLSSVWMMGGSASAAELELKHDSFVDGGQATCQQGFVAGDEGAVTFTHDADYTLSRVQFLFCGADTTETVTVLVYLEAGGAVPGTAIHQANYQVEGSANGLSEVDLSSANLAFGANQSFRFAIRPQHDGPPGLARDGDGTSMANINWIYDSASSAWGDAASFGVNGDWIVRAIVEVADGGAGGGGSPMMPAATTSTSTGMNATGGGGGAGGTAPTGETSSDGGCSVGVGRARSLGEWLWGLGAWVALGRVRRRRRDP